MFAPIAASIATQATPCRPRTKTCAILWWCFCARWRARTETTALAAAALRGRSSCAHCRTCAMSNPTRLRLARTRLRAERSNACRQRGRRRHVTPPARRASSCSRCPGLKSGGLFDAQSFGVRMVNTGIGEVRTTRSATEPMSAWARPLRPCVPSTIASHPSSCAAATISSGGLP